MTDTKNPNKINPTPTSTQMKPEVEGTKNGPVLESVKTLPAAESSNTQKIFSKFKSLPSSPYIKGLCIAASGMAAAWYLTPDDFKQDVAGKVKNTYDKYFGDGQDDA